MCNNFCVCCNSVPKFRLIFSCSLRYFMSPWWGFNNRNWRIDNPFVGPSEMTSDKRRELMLRHNVQHHLGQTEDGIVCVSLVTRNWNVWRNALSRICRALDANSSSVDTLIRNYTQWTHPLSGLQGMMPIPSFSHTINSSNSDWRANRLYCCYKIDLTQLDKVELLMT